MHAAIDSHSPNGHGRAVVEVSDRLAPLNLIGGVAVGVFLAGFSVATYLQTFTTREDLHGIAERVVVLEKSGDIGDADRDHAKDRLDRLEKYIDQRFDRLEGKVDELIKRR